MLKIITTNTYSKIEFVQSTLEEREQNHECIKVINDKMAFLDPNAKFTAAYNSFTKNGNRKWDGKVRFFNLSNFTFLTGHLPYITNIIEQTGYKYEIEDKSRIPVVNINPVYVLQDIKMRDYQIEGINIATKTNRGIFYQATNSGKTLMSIAISESIPVKTLFLVDRMELFNQAYKNYTKYSSREVGVIVPNEFEPRDITIGMQRTIWSKLKNKYTREEMWNYLQSVEMCFSDEVHKASAKTWRDVLRVMHGAYYRYGLSGTPLLSNNIRNMYLIGLVGRVIQKVSNQDLIKCGVSARPIISVLSYESEKLASREDYATAYKLGITENKIRNKLIVDCIKENKGKSILVIVKQLDHGHILKTMLEKETGYFVSGQDTKTDRIHIYNQFSNRQIPLVIASMIYKEGIDISAIDVLIYAAADKAPVTILQVLGRGLRTRKDKKDP